jgi:hypothetical protein
LRATFLTRDIRVTLRRGAIITNWSNGNKLAALSGQRAKFIGRFESIKAIRQPWYAKLRSRRRAADNDFIIIAIGYRTV